MAYKKITKPFYYFQHYLADFLQIMHDFWVDTLDREWT